MRWNELDYAPYIGFAKECIEQFQINFIISESPYTEIVNDIRTFLSIVQPSLNINNFIDEHISTMESNFIYRVADSFSRHFFVFKLPFASNEPIVLIGPYALDHITEANINKLLTDHNINATLQNEFKSYFNNITLMHDDIPLVAILDVLGKRIWTDNNLFQIVDSTSTLSYIPDTSKSKQSDVVEPIMQIKMLEQRYKLEQELMNAVSHGQTHQAELIYSRFMNSQRMEIRTPNLIRNTKNYMIILNTLLRKAAQSGYVHPIHIDNLSSQFAKKIELFDYNSDNTVLSKEMVRKYCMLVKNYSLREYSENVRNALTLITSDLTTDLSLNSIASQLNINASYLSTLFKKELGTTLTDYVTNKRIEHAIFLLNSTSLQISSVARECGIPDVQYFSKLFKKQINISPSEYRKMITD